MTTSDCDTHEKEEEAFVKPPTETKNKAIPSLKSMKRVLNHLQIEKSHLNRLIELYTVVKLRSKETGFLDESIRPPKYVTYADMFKMLERRMQLNDWLNKELAERINN
jgi:hypothetical protein